MDWIEIITMDGKRTMINKSLIQYVIQNTENQVKFTFGKESYIRFDGVSLDEVRPALMSFQSYYKIDYKVKK